MFNIDSESHINLIIYLLADPFCITRNPLRPLEGATVYFMREGENRMLLREIEGERLKHTSATENIIDQLLELMKLTTVFDDTTDTKD